MGTENSRQLLYERSPENQRGRQANPLTTKEFALLFYLAAHANRAITHRELL
jgi:DNA-binding response OmpR family regulator